VTATDQRVTAALAEHAFEQGFHAGADPSGARRRHTVDPATHAHWRAGFEAGRQAAEAATRDYAGKIKGAGE
jgi:hypothetical protein